MRGTLLAVTFLVGSVATANAGTDKKDTTKKTWVVDTSHGTFSDSIPIEVPAFRGITPKLALSYDSSDANGWAGVGWSLDGVSVIERASPGKGAPKYDSTDIYLFDGQELVACAPGSVSPSCTTGGTHSTKIESYERYALAGSGATSTWTRTLKDGTKYVFEPVYAVGAGIIYRWGLKQVIDTKGNVVTVNWGTNQFGCCWEYPTSIAYNGTTIAFHYEERSDDETSAVGNGGTRTAYGRIKTIDVTVSGSRLRAYRLSYAQSGATFRSLLTSVQQYGKNATLDGSGTVTGGTSLPATTIAYQAGSSAFALGSSDGVMSNAEAAKFFAIDINGDGKTDMLELYPSFGAMRRRTWISNGTGFTNASDASGMSTSADAHFLPMDVNADGKTDVVELYPNFLSRGLRVWTSNGTGFVQASNNGSATGTATTSKFIAMDINGDGKSDMLELYSSWGSYRRVSWISNGTQLVKGLDETGINYNADTRFFAMDVNGDGKSDLLELFPSWGAWSRRIWLSNGPGLVSGAQDSSMTHSADTEFIPMDANGDGKTDLLELFPFLGTTYRKIWLSTGYSFTAASDVAGVPFSTGNWFLALDANGDGKSDLVEMNPNGLWYQRKIWISSGTAFVGGATDVQVGSSSSTKIMAADVNGDGLSEMLELYPATFVKGRRVWSMSGTYPDLLASLTTSLGGTTSVGYTASAAWSNTNSPPITQTATTVTIADGRGGVATTSYSYQGGLYDRIERKFMGFRYEKETLPCITGEATCPYKETWYRQDYGAASKPERIDHRTGGGQLLTSSLYEYTTNGATVPWTSLRTGNWEHTLVGSGAPCPGSACKRTYTSRTYNAYGEVTMEVDHGDYDAGGDEDTVTTAFYPNTTKYIVNKPADVKKLEGVGTSGALLTEAITYYDGAATWAAAPSAGLPTIEGRWLSSPSSFVLKSKQYDAWGNVTVETNPVGAWKSYAIDPTYHLFRTSETNELGQVTSTAWDVVCGKQTQTTDLNGQATTLSYDALCRLVQKNEPGGKFETHIWVNLGNPQTQYEVIEEPAGWSAKQFDGLGRTWRNVTRGPNVSPTGDIYVDVTFNARGKESSETAPYYWVAGAPQPTTYVTTKQYDALDRPTRVTHPDGAFTTKSYGLWSVTETDELGRAKTDFRNADGKRILHDETVGGQIETTTYVYDARGNLAETIDPFGHVTSYMTDSLGRNTLLGDPDWGTWTYEYDGADRLVAQTDAKGQRTTFTYDALDRKTGKTSNAGTGAAVTVSWTYDQVRAGYFNVGKLTTMTDGAGSKTIDHDVAGNVVKTVRTISGTSYTFLHGFDAARRTVWTTYPDGGTLGTAASPVVYDGAGRIASVPGFVTSALYNAAGNLTRLDSANGAVSVRSYSATRGWLTAISTTKGATTLQSLGYTRNAKGMITQVTSPFANEGWTYAYDELDRLTTATNTSSPTYNQTLAYDVIGNITSNSRFGAYSYSQAHPHAATAAGSNTYSYDAAGLMISGAGRTLTWNGDNRVATIVGGGADLAFTYDADGVRIAQTDGGITRRHLGDDYEIQVGGATTKYVSVAGMVVARMNGSTATWVHTDHIGSIQAETDASGVEVHRKKYRSYGEVLSVAGTVEPRGYTGQRLDASNLLYLHARYYDPALGRFISPDVTIDGTDTVGLNRYAYCANDPINYSDVEGTEKTKPKDPITRGINAAKKNGDFADEPPTLGEPGKDKVRYSVYQKPVAKVGSHFKTIVTNAAGEQVGVYSLAGLTDKYNDTNPSTDGYKLAGTIYKNQESVQAFDSAYMKVAGGGVYALGDSNAAVHKAIQAIGEPKGVFTVANPVGGPVAAYGYDNADQQ